MEKIVPRKPRMYFDASPRASHVTFDDGKVRPNVPWTHYAKGEWNHDTPNTIKLTMGDFVVVIMGKNLGPLYAAIEERTLVRIHVEPDFANALDHAADTFATEIRFMKTGSSTSKGQLELEIG